MNEINVLRERYAHRQQAPSSGHRGADRLPAPAGSITATSMARRGLEYASDHYGLPYGQVPGDPFRYEVWDCRDCSAESDFEKALNVPRAELPEYGVRS